MPNQTPDGTVTGSAPSTGAGSVPSIEAVEGRLLAQRKVLALMLARMLEQEKGNDLRDVLESLSVIQDHQEDPGAILSPGVVIQGALANEVREIVRAASRVHGTALPD